MSDIIYMFDNTSSSCQIDQETTSSGSQIDGKSSAQRQNGVGICLFIVTRKRQRVAFYQIGDNEGKFHRYHREFHQREFIVRSMGIFYKYMKKKTNFTSTEHKMLIFRLKFGSVFLYSLNKYSQINSHHWSLSFLTLHSIRNASVSRIR